MRRFTNLLIAVANHAFRTNDEEANGRRRRTKELSHAFPNNWWKLRTKFRQSIPSTVTDSYLAAVLSMTAASARNNVMPYLRAFGLIDQDSKPTELVKPWRDDEGYSGACKKILEATYTQELIEVIDDVETGRSSAERWFLNNAGVGQNAAGKMASIFMVVYEGDVSKSSNERKSVVAKKPVKAANAAMKRPSKPEKVSEERPDNEGSGKHPLRGPDVNINLQIHISADASPEQIEQIFQSMSKHLYKNG